LRQKSDSELLRYWASGLCAVFDSVGARGVLLDVTLNEETNSYPGSKLLVTVTRVCACCRCEIRRQEEMRLEALDAGNFDEELHND
jgi:hypothetical protein